MSHYSEQIEEHQRQEQARRRAELIGEVNRFVEASDNSILLELVRALREFDRLRVLLSFLRW